jgi:small subunit ribosomal protein S21
MTDVRYNKAEEKMIQNGDSKGAFESMLTRFNRLVNSSGILRDVKEHEFYEKPCIKRRRKIRESAARRRKEGRNALYKKGRERKTRPLGR